MPGLRDELGARLRARPREHVQHTGRQAGLGEALGHVQPGARRLVPELEHDGVAVDQRRRELPHGNRDREVPRGDQADRAERTAHGVEPLVRDRGRVHLPDRPPRLTCRVAEDRRRAQRLEPGLAQRLPHLRGHVLGDLLRASLEDVRRLAEERGPLGRGQRRPRRERLASRVDRGARVVGIRGRVDAGHLGRPPRVVLLVGLAAGALAPLAADVVPRGRSGEGLRHGLQSFRGGWRRARRDSRGCRCPAPRSRRHGRARA